MIELSHNREKPDIVLIVLDTHRADRLGMYGAKGETSPNLDAFARSAYVFDQAIAPAQWTIPSHASLFTGLTPSAHMVVQAASILDGRFVTFAELLSGIGYETCGYCNNPLVGLVQNHLRRGFSTFYNYCGTLPSLPETQPNGDHNPLHQVMQRIRRTTRQVFEPIVAPIQNRFATSNAFLQAAAMPLFTPLWTSFVHYKGDTVRSIRDFSSYIRQRHDKNFHAPSLLFLNMMETHLPYTPPREWALKFAPYLRDEPKAQAFLNEFNHHAMRWLIPLKEPFDHLQSQVINDLYSAEAAFQDHELGRLFEQLEKPSVRDHTLVIIVADHGEMLGEHGFMGHGFGVYHELIRVPMMIRLPGQQQSERIGTPVATRRIFQTVLEAGGIGELDQWNGSRLNVGESSLFRELEGNSNRAFPVVSEAYAPLDAIKMMERREPELIEPLHTRDTHRAIYHGQDKLYDIEQVGSRLTDVFDKDRSGGTDESHSESSLDRLTRIEALRTELNHFVQGAREGWPEGWTPPLADLIDARIEQRLRDLGYMA